MVISAFQKDYEIQSWNEQGEITGIEGMFIIDFLLFFPCSHIDSKHINLIIEIHYTINMPYDSEFSIKKREGFDYSKHEIKRNKELDDFIDKLYEKLGLKGNMLIPSCSGDLPPHFYYTVDKIIEKVGAMKDERDILKREIEEIKSQHQTEINNLRKEFDEKISELKNEIFELKEILCKNPKWIKKDGYYRRWIGKDEQIWTPPIKDFYYEKVEPKKVTKTTVFYRYNDKKHRDKNPDYNPDKDTLQMPRSLYDQLCEEPNKLSIHDVDDLPSVKRYIHFIDKDAKMEKKYLNRVANFLLNHRDSKFKFEELNRDIKFKSKQSGYDLLREFEKWGFIKQEVQGYYIVIF